MSFIQVAVQRPVTVAMGVVTLLLFGLISLSDLKINLLPDLSYPTLTVRTEYPGGAPAEIETLITKPLEENVGVVKNVRTVKSVSRAGQSDVILTFNWGADMDMAGLDVREKLEVLRLPLEATRPLILRFDPSTDPILRLALALEAPVDAEASEVDEARLKILRRFADLGIKKRLEPVAGVAAVKISGGLEDEVHIDIDAEKLAQLNITAAQLSQRLAAENVNVSAGRLDDGSQRYLVRTINQFSSIEDIGKVIISTGTGRPVYLEDIAEVSQSHKEREAIIRSNAQEAVEIAIYKEGDANTVAVTNSVHQALEQLKDELPDGMEIVTVDDQSVFIHNAIQQVSQAALFGGLLAMLVIFLFLRDIASTVIIALAIPVSIVATFFLMQRTGISLNIMSLGGIALATGLLVDNAIVVLENIARHRATGIGRFEAAVNGTREVGAAVVASTLTTVAVFLPLAFVQGVAGQLFSDQALTVTFALVISLLVATTVIPTLSARLSRKRNKHAGEHESDGVDDAASDSGGRVLGWVRKCYVGILEAALRQRFIVVSASIVLLVLACTFLARQDLELIPQLAQGSYEVTLELPPGSPLQRTDKVVANVQQAAQGINEIDFAYGVSGTGNRIDVNPTESGENIGRLLIALQNPDTVSEQRSMQQLRRVISQSPGVEANFARPALLSFSKPIEIEIAGFDLPNLKQASEQVVARLRQSDRFIDIESSMAQGHPEVQVVFDQERAAALGLTVKEISDQLVNSVRGAVATRYSWRDRKVDILVRAAEADRSSIDDIRNLVINPASTRPVTLESVAQVIVTEGPAEIRRSDQQRVAVVSANISYGALSSALQEAESMVQSLPLPPAFSVGVVGQNEELEASTRSLVFALALAVFLVYLVMASQFESLLQPLVILFSVPLAAVGVALVVAVTGMPLSVMVFIGLIMLAGIVVNNAIVLLDLINHLREQGVARADAIVQAGKQRLRPILMTTLTTIMGLAPMALGLGEGAEIRAPMALTVISGLMVSTLLTLVVIPVVYSLLDQRSDQALLNQANRAANAKGNNQVSSTLTTADV